MLEVVTENSSGRNVTEAVRSALLTPLLGTGRGFLRQPKAKHTPAAAADKNCINTSFKAFLKNQTLSLLRIPWSYRQK